MNAEYLKHKDGTKFVPVTSPDAVIDSEGKSLTTNLTQISTKVSTIETEIGDVETILATING